MRIISYQEQFHIADRTAVALGKFDGVHLGHQRLIDHIVKAKEDGLLSAVFTFEIADDLSFKMSEDKVLSTREEKRRLLDELGVDILVEFPLNDRTAAIEPEDFITKYLCEGMNAALVVAGPDLSYGHMGKGDFHLLKSMQKQCRCESFVVDKVFYEGQSISSTRIRALLEEGNMEAVNAMLGRPYHILGKVRHGKKLGRTLGFPTVNQIPDEHKLLPAFGVYFSRVCIDGKYYNSITNIGVRPSVDDGDAVNAETFIYDFDGQIYDETIMVELVKFSRPEMKFESFEALKARLLVDFDEGRAYHSTRG